MASITWLVDALREAGVAIVEHGDWRARGVSGSFNPIGVLWHHTAATSSPSNPAPALNICINGRPDLQGPLCHALVDYNGVFHVISANRANHAGSARVSGPIPAGDGNTMLIGWEIDYNGVSQSMTPAQYWASIAATAAVLRRLGRDSSFVRGHRETSTTGKIDPSFIDLDAMRRDVAAALAGGLGSGPMFHQVRSAAGEWSGFWPLAGYGTTAPGDARDMAIAGLPDGTAQVLIVGADGGVYHQVRHPDHWTGFQPLPGLGTPTTAGGQRVSIAGMPDGTAQVLIVGADGGVYHQTRHPDHWTGFQPVAGAGTTSTAIARDVAIAGMPDGSAQVLIIGADGGVYHQTRRPDGNWTGFQPVAGMGTPTMAGGSRVSIAGMADGTAQLLIIGADGGVYHQVRGLDGTWAGFQPVAGYGTSTPAHGRDVAITGLPDGTAQVLIIGADGGVYHQTRHPDSWTGFQPVAGQGTSTTALGSAVSIAGMPDGSAQVTLVGSR